MMRSFAVELGTRNPNVRVNCILPGPVMLPPDLPEAERRDAIEATLVQHEGSPKNIALAVLHFIDNDFVTGTACPSTAAARFMRELSNLRSKIESEVAANNGFNKRG